MPDKVWRGIVRLSEQFGPSALVAHRKTCDDYAVEVLGDPIFAPWLYLYTLAHGEFREGWIPGGYAQSFVYPQINGSVGRAIGGTRWLCDQVVPEASADALGYRFNGRMFTRRGGGRISDEFGHQMFAEDDEIVFKSDNSSEGRGVRRIQRDEAVDAVISELPDGSFQRLIRQHEDFDRFADNSLATLRVVTVLNAEQHAECRGSYLRLGRVDDDIIKASSALRVPVGPDGRLQEWAWLPDFTAIKRHPDSHKEFEGLLIPAFAAAVEFAVKTHERRLPFLGLVGWDLAIDAHAEVRVIEINCRAPAVTALESMQGPCFAGLGWEQLR